MLLQGHLADQHCCELTNFASCTGVRARQERVVFATCEDEDTLREEVESLLGEGALTCLAEAWPHGRVCVCANVGALVI